MGQRLGHGAAVLPPPLPLRWPRPCKTDVYLNLVNTTTHLFVECRSTVQVTDRVSQQPR